MFLEIAENPKYRDMVKYFGQIDNTIEIIYRCCKFCNCEGSAILTPGDKILHLEIDDMDTKGVNIINMVQELGIDFMVCFRLPDYISTFDMINIEGRKPFCVLTSKSIYILRENNAMPFYMRSDINLFAGIDFRDLTGESIPYDMLTVNDNHKLSIRAASILNNSDSEGSGLNVSEFFHKLYIDINFKIGMKRAEPNGRMRKDTR